MIYIIRTVFTLLLFPSVVFAQLEFKKKEKKPVAIEIMVGYGEIIKHTPSFQPTIENITTMIEVGIIRKSQGKHLWEQLHNHPQVGLSLLYTNFNQPDIFGKAIAIYPHITFKFLKNQHSNAFFQIGSGVAYLNKKFDYNTNSTNNVIGSKINNVTKLHLGYNYNINTKWSTALRFGLSHFSNSSVRKPNLGINVVSLNASVIYTPNPLLIEKSQTRLPSFNKSIRPHLRLSLAFRESSPPGGPTYLIQLLNVGIQKQINLKNKIGVGLEGEYNEAVKDFITNQELFENNSKWNNTRLQIFIYNEFLFNKIGLSGQVGYYVHSPFPASSKYTFKLGLHYYILNHYSNKHQLYIASFLKSHLSVAQFLEIGVGYVF